MAEAKTMNDLATRKGMTMAANENDRTVTVPRSFLQAQGLALDMVTTLVSEVATKHPDAAMKLMLEAIVIRVDAVAASIHDAARTYRTTDDVKREGM
jgi:hypothetical protein